AKKDDSSNAAEAASGAGTCGADTTADRAIKLIRNEEIAARPLARSEQAAQELFLQRSPGT
ncbi:MAG: hypothetical protein WA820_14760, partial [Bradyrhizobium sp.]